jgi:hypothetical protein
MRLKFFGHRGHWNLWPDVAGVPFGFAASFAGRLVDPLVLFFPVTRAAERAPSDVASNLSIFTAGSPRRAETIVWIRTRTAQVGRVNDV